MFREFRMVLKEKEFRGWRLEEEDDHYYLSKFDDRFNDDEFRFYLEFSDEDIHISKMLKIKSYRKVMKVDSQNIYLQQALQLCEKFHILAEGKKRA